MFPLHCVQLPAVLNNFYKQIQTIRF